MNNINRKRHLDFKGSGRIVQIKPPKHGWGGEDITPPPYHPDNYFSIRNTYSQWDRSFSKEKPDHYTYEVSTIATFLNTLWGKVRSDLESPINDVWTEYITNYSKTKINNRYSWERSQNKDLLSLTCELIERFYDNFDKEEKKPLLLRLMMTVGN